MEQSTRKLLSAIAAACRQIGMSNDVQDRGDTAEASRMRERARQSIADALEAASADDSERIRCLFGPDPRSCFDRNSWSTSEDYIEALLASDPELPLDGLRRRQARFRARIEELRSAEDAHEAHVEVRYAPPASPSMLAPLRKLVERYGDPAGWLRIGEVTYHLNLGGEGLAHEHRVGEPAIDDALIDGVWIHVSLDRVSARSGLVVTLRSRHDGALARTERELRQALAEAGWEPLVGRAER